MVICLECSTDLHMTQLMPLPVTVSCFSKIQISLPFWYRLNCVVPDKGPLNVCVCALVTMSHTQPEISERGVVFQGVGNFLRLDADSGR